MNLILTNEAARLLHEDRLRAAARWRRSRADVAEQQPGWLRCQLRRLAWSRSADRRARLAACGCA